MRELTGRPILRRCRGSDDRGAVAVLTAVLMSGALIAFAMFAVDVGQSYDAHRQVRNGADAAALAIAQVCARNLDTNPTAPCTSAAGTSAASLANQLAAANTVPGASTSAESVCGSAPGLPLCSAVPAGSSILSTCRPAAASDGASVEVRTRTGATDGSNQLTPIFGPTAGVVRACARAVYGQPKSMLSFLPLTFSKCVLLAYKAKYTDSAHPEGQYAPAPPYSPSASAFKSWETVIQFHQAGGACATTSSGQNAPGNFGYLDDTGNGPCKAYTQVGDTVGGDTGNGNPATLGCSDTYLTSLLNTIVYLPVFDPDKTTGTGSNVQYSVIGYMGLYFTGWKLTSTSHDSTVSGSAGAARTLCPNPQTCIFGYMVRNLLPTPGDVASSSDNFGTTVVTLRG